MQYGQLKRREFISLIGGVAAWPIVAGAQQLPMPLIGYLSSESPDSDLFRLTAFRQGLTEVGYVEGRNVSIECRWAKHEFAKLSALAAELVQGRVDVMVTPGLPSTLAAKAATGRIPVIFVVGIDPVQVGLVASLNRPEDNLTGFNQVNGELGAKGIEVLHELFPSAMTIGLLENPRNPVAEFTTKDVLAAANVIGLTIQRLYASTDGEIDTVFITLLRAGTPALLVSNDIFFNGQINRFVALAEHHRIAAIYPSREYVLAGGLMSYGASLKDTYRQIALYTSRILKGSKPAELPVQQQTRIEFAINVKAAKALGLNFPLSLLGRADEVIE